MTRANQILLDHSLDYVPGIEPSDPQDLMSKEATDILADTSRRRLFESDSLITTFTLPEDAIASSVEAFVDQLMVDPVLLIFPADNQVQVPVAPTVPPVFIHYLPATGLKSGNEGRVTPYVGSIGGSPAVEDLDGTLNCYNTNGGDLTVILPDMTGYDGIITRFKNIGSNDLIIEPDASDTIDGYEGGIILSPGASVILRFLHGDHRWVSHSRQQVVTFAPMAGISCDEPIMEPMEVT